MFDFTEGDKKMQQLQDFQNTINEIQGNKLQNDYSYYKKQFMENQKLDDIFDFE